MLTLFAVNLVTLGPLVLEQVANLAMELDTSGCKMFSARDKKLGCKTASLMDGVSLVHVSMGKMLELFVMGKVICTFDYVYGILSFIGLSPLQHLYQCVLLQEGATTGELRCFIVESGGQYAMTIGT